MRPGWAAPAAVQALTTLRPGGLSAGALAGLNLAAHVGDRPRAVESNRRALRAAVRLPAEPLWLDQVHGTRVIEAGNWAAGIQADGCWTRDTGTVCAVLTADCLPVLLCTVDGEAVAAVHAGWRGLAAGILEAAVHAMAVHGSTPEVIAWLGPAIGPDAFEVGDEVRAALVGDDEAAGRHFRPSAGGRWLASLPALARDRLRRAGVRSVSGGSWCTVADPERFYSHRRDRQTGRMATLIWRQGRE